MNKLKIGVVGFGTIGQRLADAVVLQSDMELVGVADLRPGLAVRALAHMPAAYPLYLADGADAAAFAAAGVTPAGTLEELVEKCDVLLDATTPGAGAVNKPIYEKHHKRAIFQAGENLDLVDLYFHSYTNYTAAAGKQFLKIPSCNTTGLVRVMAVLNQHCQAQKAAVTIIRRAADPGDYQNGIINGLRMDKAPTQQALDVTALLPAVDCTGLLVHAPFTQGQTITVTVSGAEKITKEMLLNAFAQDARIRVVSTDEGFLGNASVYKYARALNAPHGDLFDVIVWEDCIAQSGNDLMFAMMVPQESVTIPETLDAARACQESPVEQTAALNATNVALKLV